VSIFSSNGTACSDFWYWKLVKKIAVLISDEIKAFHFFVFTLILDTIFSCPVTVFFNTFSPLFFNGVLAVDKNQNFD